MRFYYIHRDDIRKWQLSTLCIQQKVQKIFEEYSINGWCGGGTLIGAARNSGFLYWDNDLDMFFEFKNYRRIIESFREKKFFDSYDLVYFRDGYWQKYDKFMRVLRGSSLEEDLFDFDLAELEKGMFKLFSKKSIKVKLYTHDFKQPQKYVKIHHFAPIHYTRKRLASKNLEIENGSEFRVIPELCMLPMMEMSYNAYLSFLYRYTAKSILMAAAKSIDYPERHLEIANGYPNKNCLPPASKFDKGLLNPIHARASLLGKNLMRGTKRYIKLIHEKKRNSATGKLVVYRPIFFRFFVMPFLYEDIFPLKKASFENANICVPNNVEAVLETQFGNFRSVPKIENRIAYPFFFENLIWETDK